MSCAVKTPQKFNDHCADLQSVPRSLNESPESPETVPWGAPVRTLGRLGRADGGGQYGSDERLIYNPPPGDSRSAPPAPPAVLAIC